MNLISKKIRTITLAALTGLATIGATAALPAAPTSAATSVTFCFDFANPPSWTDYANRPVYLYDALPSGELRLIRTGTTNAAGCGTFYNTNPTVRMYVRAYIATAYQTWDSWSAWSASHPANPGNGGVNLGTGLVNRTR